MDLDLELEDRGDYLYARITGEKTFESLLEAIGKIAQKSAETDATRILIDSRDFRGYLQTMETYDLVVERMEGFRDRGPVEVVILDNDITPNRFFEDLAVNRGWLIRVMTDEEEALRWMSR